MRYIVLLVIVVVIQIFGCHRMSKDIGALDSTELRGMFKKTYRIFLIGLVFQLMVVFFVILSYFLFTAH